MGPRERRLRDTGESCHAVRHLPVVTRRGLRACPGPHYHFKAEFFLSLMIPVRYYPGMHMVPTMLQ